MLPRSFTTTFDRLLNILINNARIGQAFDIPDQQYVKPKENIPNEFLACWDTGATNSVITERVITECELKPEGMTKVSTALGERDSETFFVSIWLPNKVCFPHIRVTKGDLSHGIDILIGMDIINQGDFVVNNKDGKTSFSFRIPSLEFIDYTKPQKPNIIPPTADYKRKTKRGRR